jgi:hypothetical protein
MSGNHSNARVAMAPFGSFVDLLTEIEDPRRTEGKLYRLPHVVLFAIRELSIRAFFGGTSGADTGQGSAREYRQRMLDIALVATERIEPTAIVRNCRDPKDDRHLALATAGKADVIVSGDARHRQAMHPWRDISILSPADHLALA